MHPPLDARDRREHAGAFAVGNAQAVEGDVAGGEIELDPIDRDAPAREALQADDGGVANDLRGESQDRHAQGRERDEDDERDQPDGAASDHERGLSVPSIPR